MLQCLKKRKKYWIAAVLSVLFLAVASLLFVFLSVPEERKQDRKRLSTEEYNTVFLSMFPIDHFQEEDYSYYRLQYIVKASHCFRNIRSLKSDLKLIADSGNEVSHIYLGVLPGKLPAVQLAALIRKYPATTFHVILAHPYIEYWQSLSEKAMNATLQSYREMTDTLLCEGNACVYLFSREWLICNPSNYADRFLTTPETSLTIMLNCDKEHRFLVTAENVDTVFSDFTQLLEASRTVPVTYPDLSGYKVVFFGDSVIGNYTDCTGIPGVVKALTNATVYNCGLGGNSASYHPKAPINLPGIVDAFCQGDPTPLPADTQVLRGVTEFLQDTTDAKKLCFIINYGLNDYFNGAPVSTDDPYDPMGYSGALRTAITTLQGRYPDSQIILAAPNFTAFFNNGTDKNSDTGGVLTDYVNAVISLGEEYHIDVLDNYNDLGINADNFLRYLCDYCHPNEDTRFTMGSRIATIIR